ncbi:uncharacterized protein DUF2757 [Orenia metallireducens]|jgi:hypothetical protein|uniref:Uncharacterized protein n=1 Tax=Orenia metallireducens TaxID=1413210 RepID=A0A285H0B0_9FIRM|nr:anti-sigma-F factor Fin [Orenia metallireducens]PRX26497.1 uncharacterized protein DUF2757 [Orenia metallireducens]SNY28984.1 Protein of unknown function [Orenia metallireducens]
MNVIYRCDKCHKIIEHLQLEDFNQQSLGLNILTDQEKEDIIKMENDTVYIDLTCDDCIEEYDWSNFINNEQIH